MKDETAKLIQLISEEKTLNEISTCLHLSNKQLFMRLSMLKNSGYLFERKYDSKGEVTYSFQNPFKTEENTKHLFIEMPEHFDTIEMVLVSDTHIGNKRDKLDAIDAVYDYCAKNDVHTILNAGDFFEGIYPGSNRIKYQIPKEQIAYALKKYPYDKNILNFVLLGNHDASFWIEDKIDVQKILLDRRHDIIPIGYGYGIVSMGGYLFELKHPIERKNVKINIPRASDNRVTLKGHSHKFAIKSGTSNLIVNVPTLSGVSVKSNQKPIPSMVTAQFKIQKEKIVEEYFQEFVFVNKTLIRISELTYRIPISRLLKKTETLQNGYSSNTEKTLIKK